MSRAGKEAAAIVLDCHDYGESDRIVIFFCQGLGRMTGIAKGAKRSQKRFVNKLEIFSSLFLHYTESKNGNLAFIAEAELVESFLSLRQNASLFIVATAMRESVLIATHDLEGDDGIFDLLQWGLHSLESQQPAMTVLTFFQIKFLEQIGYRPNLESCLQCKQPFVGATRYGFDSRQGSLLCQHCQGTKSDSTIFPLFPGTIKILESAQNQPLHRLHRLHLSGSGICESLSFLYHYQRHLLQQDIYSLKILSDAHWQI